jgi:hypothetical protein
LERAATENNAEWALQAAAVTYLRFGRRAEADAVLARYADGANAEGVGAGEWAQYYVVRGDFESARQHLETAVETLERGQADAGFFALRNMLDGMRRVNPQLATSEFSALFARLDALAAG